MSRNTMIILILIIPISLWLNLYAYYKYGKSLRKKKENTKKPTGGDGD